MEAEPWSGLGLLRPPGGHFVALGNGHEVFVRQTGTRSAPRRKSRSPESRPEKRSTAARPVKIARRKAKRSRKAPPVLLLHGWFASGGLNWIRAFEPLSKRHAVCAPDLLGHAGSVPGKPAGSLGRAFEIERCADDMAELLDLLHPGEPALVAGYSLGGMVAQALWRRHPQVVRGLVLGATSAAPVPIARGRRPFVGAMNLARDSSRFLDRLTQGPRRFASSAIAALPKGRGLGRMESPLGHWATSEFMGHHWPTVLDAGRAIAEFDARGWIGDIDVPTSVLLTERDGLIPPVQQHAMAAAIRGARVQPVDAGHLACVRSDFGDRLAACCRAVETARA